MTNDFKISEINLNTMTSCLSCTGTPLINKNNVKGQNEFYLILIDIN